MHVLANDDDDGSNDASDLVEEKITIGSSMLHRDGVTKKKRIISKPF